MRNGWRTVGSGRSFDRLARTPDNSVLAATWHGTSGSLTYAVLILLANSKAKQVRTYDGTVNGIITRAKAEVLVFSRSTPANQSATRSKLIAAAVARCWR